MGETKVSVIIPIFNVERYIAECIESVQNQTLREIEIICVNDGTTDNSMKIVEMRALEDSRIKIINQKNGGLSVARNAGLAQAMGEYILFLDSDDYIVPIALEELYTQSKENALDCLCFDANVFFETEKVKDENNRYVSYYIRKGNYFGIYEGMELFCKMWGNSDFKPSACLQLIHTNLVKNNNITFYNGIIHEDNLFSFQVLFYSHKVMYRKKAYYVRRVRENSIMTTAQAIKSAYGYYICVVEISGMLEKKHIRMDEIIVIKSFLASLQAIAMNLLNEETEYDKFFEDLAAFPIHHVMGLILWVYEMQKRIQLESCIIKRENGQIKNSLSYKLGLFMTYIPRKIYHAGDLIVKKMKSLRYRLHQLMLNTIPNKICVSVIIPVYNASKYIGSCMDSLICQSLKNIEIICINDGSMDNSLEILKEYQQKDKRIIIIDQENQGAGSARNNGMMHARGEYLLFLDADDYFSPKLCDLTYYHAKSKRAQVCLLKADRVDMSSGRKEYMNWVFRENEIPKKVFSALEIKEKIFQITTACPWSKLFKRSFVMKNHLEFQNIKNANDVVFVRTACALASRITCVREEPLVIYRFNDESSIQGRKDRAPLEFFKAFKELKMQLDQRNIYSYFERSFINMILEECLFNYKTVGSESIKEYVGNALVKEVFPFFKLEKYDKDYFYNYRSYENYKEMIKRIC